jgi:hypothetical protein
MNKAFLSLQTLLLMASYGIAQSNTHFSYSLETRAEHAKIWQIWCDVPNWQQWDAGLKSAELLGAFAIGTRGKLIPDKGPKSSFILTELVAGKSYTFKTKLPLGALYVKRYLEEKEGKTYFTHEVRFSGLSKGIFGNALGENYRRILPEVMTRIREIAEQ